MNLQKRLKVLAVFLVMLFSPAAAALAGGGENALFAGVPFSADLSVEKRAAEKRAAIDPTVIRSRSVHVNFDNLAGASFPEGADDIGLNLYADTYYKAVKDRLEERAGDSYTWFGHIEGAEYSQVVLVVEDGVMAGNIMVNGKLFQIRSTPEGVYAVYEIDPSAFPEETPPILLPYEMDLKPKAAPETARDSGSIMDVMVVYTADAAAGSSDIEAEIQLAIDETNQAYANSGVTQRVRLVHSEQITYTEAGNMSTDLYDLQDPSDGVLDGVHATRDTFGADYVSLWVEDGGGSCGIGFQMASVAAGFQAWAFSVVARSCATGYYSFGHELGHNMGARHDWYVDINNNLPYTYNHGYVDIVGQWRTIMAYNTECSDGFVYCTRVPYLSNPDVSYLASPTGIAEGETDAADNRKALDNTASTGANFKSSIAIPDVATDTSAYTTGDTLTLSIGITNPDTETTVDVYVAVMLPDGSLLFVEYDIGAGQSTFVPGTLDSATWTPAASALTLVQGFDLADFPLLQYTFTGGEPSGTYFWFMALTSAGTTNVIGGVVSSSFTFAP